MGLVSGVGSRHYGAEHWGIVWLEICLLILKTVLRVESVVKTIGCIFSPIQISVTEASSISHNQPHDYRWRGFFRISQRLIRFQNVRLVKCS